LRVKEFDCCHEVKITLETAKFGKNDPLFSMKQILFNFPNIAASGNKDVKILVQRCIQNENVVGDIPLTWNPKLFNFYLHEEFFLLKIRFLFSLSVF
jgi:hypothetical protein